MSIKELASALKIYYANAEEAEKIILTSAALAAAADAVGSWVPVLAVPAAIVSSFGAVWHMYAKLCKKLDISIKENVLKLLARAALANIAANLGSVIVTMLVSIMIPGASIAASAITVFLAVYLAGLIFLRFLLKLAEKSADPHSFSDMSKSDMKEVLSGVSVTKADLNDARAAYASNRAK